MTLIDPFLDVVLTNRFRDPLIVLHEHQTDVNDFFLDVAVFINHLIETFELGSALKEPGISRHGFTEVELPQVVVFDVREDRRDLGSPVLSGQAVVKECPSKDSAGSSGVCQQPDRLFDFITLQHVAGVRVNRRKVAKFLDSGLVMIDDQDRLDVIRVERIDLFWGQRQIDQNQVPVVDHWRQFFTVLILNVQRVLRKHLTSRPGCCQTVVTTAMIQDDGIG
ncbi:hypothetical protein D9M70_345750 [compost metagenome]